MDDLFEFEDYKDFLNGKLDELDQGGRGSRARMSRFIGCQTAYTAQVLRGSAQLSLEQAEGINDFLGHTEEQGQYFLLLVQVAKAGTPKLKSRFRKQLEQMQQSRKLLKNRLNVKENLREHEQLVYYSSWVFGAVHALVSIPDFQNPEQISKRLDISMKQSGEVLQFLIDTGLVEKKASGNLEIGKGQIHLGADSPLISRHHLNWRLQAMRQIERDPQFGLHYSSVISISRDDHRIIRERIVALLKEVKPIIRDSREEELYSLSMDFFSVHSSEAQ